ncbi:MULTISPECIES: histidine phosphatase family protein [unclassified Streptomyces]|uniref:histidine phosphatase family protein n=1 Tax=unclassified Streptomyces TaxID=2593676 RepID=UPI00136B5380|nr:MULTISPECIES: histidine phosphatase family protein [unclassified Streptomyces]NEA04070.1 histidine phosphatase family protein [Streptomyces sp. SID10116]MYY81229.1 histidine phosphatase family protein [Streptomyces sp. SID335]MYZ19355.1 histidine phosphatase family protein [Streptomyces sp. SID337]NDZ88538.1 histidine phosphatase family protein [Streptomyces sp. SID10115]NEB50482.1 histidine phosphatase family protein [Streptomyces sp. SID339]
MITPTAGTAAADLTSARYLYLTRHGEATPDERGLTPGGRRQAALLGERLRDIPFAAVHHGPLPRAEQTATLISDALDGDVPLIRSAPAGDYLPYIPHKEELPPETADATLERLARFPDAERENGPALAAEALSRFTGPVPGGTHRHELVVTHNFLTAWLVRAALEAPPARWLGLNHCNAALTVIRYAPGRPAALVLYNDMGHLPEDLRWTGFPPELRA